MAGTYLNFPFDEDVFNYRWKQFQDPVLTAFLTSGAVVEDAEIARLIANGSDVFTTPYYSLLSDTAPVNYDGVTDITTEGNAGTTMSGIVFGRAKGWKETQFVRDYNSGADPMGYIASQVGAYWNHYRQKLLLGIAGGVAGVSAFSSHVIDTNAAPTATVFGDACQTALGDNKNLLTMAVMHSYVAQQLADLDLLEYRKYTDRMGVQRTLNVADFNGLTVIIDDSMPVSSRSGTAGVYTITVAGTPASGDVLTVNGIQVTLDETSAADATAAATALKAALDADATFSANFSMSRSSGVITCTEKSGKYGLAGKPTASVSASAGSTIAVATTTAGVTTGKDYKTFLFAPGFFRHATAPVTLPVEVARDAAKNGGMNMLYTRIRECYHPAGFSYTKPNSNYTASPTDLQLFDSSNWSLVADAKTVGFVSVETQD